MVPRDGIEPPTRGFSIRFFSFVFKSLPTKGPSNCVRDIKYFAMKRQTFREASTSKSRRQRIRRSELIPGSANGSVVRGYCLEGPIIVGLLHSTSSSIFTPIEQDRGQPSAMSMSVVIPDHERVGAFASRGILWLIANGNWWPPPRVNMRAGQGITDGQKKSAMAEGDREQKSEPSIWEVLEDEQAGFS